jgi:hypothetical protein
VVCSSSDTPPRTKVATVQGTEGRGIVIVNDLGKTVASNYGSFPSSAVSNKDGSKILSYVKSQRAAVATITRTPGSYI